jgi:hypothetical protein
MFFSISILLYFTVCFVNYGNKITNYKENLRSSLILGLATKRPKLKTQKVLWLDHLKIVIIGTYNKDTCTWHNTQVFGLTYFSGSHRSKKLITKFTCFVTISPTVLNLCHEAYIANTCSRNLVSVNLSCHAAPGEHKVYGPFHCIQLPLQI